MSVRVDHSLGWHYQDLSDFELSFVVLGAPFSFKRAHRVITIAGHGSIALTTEAKHYLQHAAEQLSRQWRSVFSESIPLSVEMNAEIRSYLPNHRRVDASNLYEGVQDALKRCTANCKPKCKRHAGVIEDDFSIRTHDGSDRLFDPDNPRVEIVLSPYRGQSAPQATLPGVLTIDRGKTERG